MAVVLLKSSAAGGFKEVGRTERVKNELNPEFAKKIPMDYFFEEAQKMKIEVYDVDSSSAKLKAHDLLGKVECSLGEIVGVHLDQKFIVRFLAGAQTQVAVLLSLQKKLGDHQKETLAFRSEVIKNNLNPAWKAFKIPVRQLCGKNEDRPIRIECADSDDDGRHDLIGQCHTTFQQLMQGQGAHNCYNLINPKKQSKKGYKNSGVLQLMQATQYIEHTFLDYIRGGTQVHFTVAVDFTASNGNPKQPQSLHYMDPYTPNQYMMALRAVGEICQNYNTTKLFPALGFGAKFPNGVVSHELFLNFHPTDPHCLGVEGILDAYRNAIASVSLHGPTNFSSVINHVSRFASAAAGGSHYFVLLIITDGVISDFEQTKAAIVNASSLPMSIIIVGVGNASFDEMNALDSDKRKLAAHGKVAERDIVQFVPFRNYLQGGNWEYSQTVLSKAVLKEVPGQLISWMKARNIQPRPPPQIGLQDMPVQAQTMGPTPHGQHAQACQQGQSTPGDMYPPQQSS